MLNVDPPKQQQRRMTRITSLKYVVMTFLSIIAGETCSFITGRTGNICNAGGNLKRNVLFEPSPSQRSLYLLLFPENVSMNVAVEVFDGSTISESIVRSSSYWVNLKSQLAILLEAQFLSIVILAIIISFGAKRLPNILEKMGNTVATLFDGNKEERNYYKLKAAPSSSVSNSPAPPAETLPKLLVCIALDFIGSANEMIPIYGEMVDIFYAPIAAYLLRNTFGGSNVAFAIEFVEEILPFTDFLPFATICWVIDTFLSGFEIARVLQLGDFQPILSLENNNTNNKRQIVIDVEQPSKRKDKEDFL